MWPWLELRTDSPPPLFALRSLVEVRGKNPGFDKISAFSVLYTAAHHSSPSLFSSLLFPTGRLQPHSQRVPARCPNQGDSSLHLRFYLSTYPCLPATLYPPSFRCPSICTPAGVQRTGYLWDLRGVNALSLPTPYPVLLLPHALPHLLVCGLSASSDDG